MERKIWLSPPFFYPLHLFSISHYHNNRVKIYFVEWMAQFKEDSLEQVYKCIQRGGVSTQKITGLRVLCIVNRKAQRFWDFKAFNPVE